VKSVVVDTSALMAILLGEPAGKRCIEILALGEAILLSAGTASEAMVVAVGRGCRADMERLIARLGAEVVPVGAADAAAVADTYERWGKGRHPAGLNFGDCFAYTLAKARGCPLLFVGDDFAKTDVVVA